MYDLARFLTPPSTALELPRDQSFAVGHGYPAQKIGGIRSRIRRYIEDAI